MKLEYENTVEDLAALSEHFLRTRFARRTFWTTVSVPLLMLVVVLPVLALIKAPAPFLLIAASAVVVWPLAFRQSLRRSVRTAVRRMAKEDQGRVLGKHRLRFEPEALVVKSPRVETRTRWSAVQSVEETPAHVFLFLGGSSAHIVPGRAFTDPEARAAFAAEARRRIEQARTKS